ncbi:MAG: HAMP domain-containing sensor histidine kinase, partial [Paracoccaceae bacterium]
LVHAIFWSISLNSFFFFFVSILSFPRPIERLQGAQIVNVFQYEPSPQAWTAQKAQAEDLMVMCQRIMGVQQAKNLFNEEVIRQGSSSDLPEPIPDFLNRLEKELAGTVGTATAHAMISQIVGGSSISVQDLMAVADETVQIREYSQRLEQQSEQISRTARQLRIANEQLTKLSVQKDVFLSQVSHELRTPMTSILAFSEILKDEKKLSDQALKKYSDIIHAESHRLTRLLDDLLDLSVLENGQVSLNIQSVNLKSMIDKAISTVQAGNKDDKLTVKTEFSTRKRKIETDVDRLGQVFLNLVTNASKYCDAKKPTLKILIGFDKENYTVDFIDNGSGISKTDQQQIFEKFSRFGSQKSGSAGLGLAICREILKRLKGYIYYLPDKQGAAFRVVVPSRIYSE